MNDTKMIDTPRDVLPRDELGPFIRHVLELAFTLDRHATRVNEELMTRLSKLDPDDDERFVVAAEYEAVFESAQVAVRGMLARVAQMATGQLGRHRSAGDRDARWDPVAVLRDGQLVIIMPHEPRDGRDPDWRPMAAEVVVIGKDRILDLG
jgi:hypothetical protein